MQVTEADLHLRLRARMRQRGITREEIEQTLRLCSGQALNNGSAASDAKPGTLGRVLVFPYQAEWEGQFYQEKEVTVYYKMVGEATVLLTAKARYGQGFPRG